MNQFFYHFAVYFLMAVTFFGILKYADLYAAENKKELPSWLVISCAFLAGYFIHLALL